MKIKLILFAAIFGFVVSSCRKLELEPKGILGEPELFGNKDGVQKYFVNPYMKLPIEDFVYFAREVNDYKGGYAQGNWHSGLTIKNRADPMTNSLGAMSVEVFGSEFAGQTVSGYGEQGFGYWPYDDIRYVNTFISNFPNYKANYNDETYNHLMGEARFLRAFFYQGLAKRYGGVPIVKVVKDPVRGTPEELNVPRDTEYDTWKFIHDDLEFAMNNMSATSVEGRANKYVAAALMSRSMLYAGRVAKYTRYVGFDTEEAVVKGFAGMDPSKASEFFQYAYDAGKFIEGGPYSLYTKNYPDKATNFANLFLDKSSSENIFTKGYDGQIFGHSYDMRMVPSPDFTATGGVVGSPTLQSMQLYDFPALTDALGKPVRFNNPSDIKIGMEPRLLGTCYFNGDVLRGVAFDIRRGIYKTFSGPASDAQFGNNAAPVNAASNRLLGIKDQKYNGVLITGKHGAFTTGVAMMGSIMRKYVDIKLSATEAVQNKSSQSWIVFRLGEIYLNTAEAAYELDKRTEALDYVEKIRIRAGCIVTRPALDQTVSSTYGYPMEASLQFIRNERTRELYTENHWWWDIRTWRIADQVLNLFYPHALTCYYVFNEGKYIYLDEINRENRNMTAPKRAVYEKIPQGEINKNTNLLPQNPLY
jgi:hypothetical protein